MAGPLYASAALSGLPFVIAGGLKVLYDVALWRGFRHVEVEGERRSGPASSG